MTTEAEFASRVEAMAEFLGPEHGAKLRGDMAGMLAGLDAVEWIEDEIAQAQKRYPICADLLYHSFPLLRIEQAPAMVEFVYRSHARELLERIGRPPKPRDLRPGTAAEVVLLCARTSELAPLNTTGAGLYARMWLAAFPDRPVFAEDQAGHYEALRGPQIEDGEREARRKLARPYRVLDPREIRCGGKHWGKKVACLFASGPLRNPPPPVKVRAAKLPRKPDIELAKRLAETVGHLDSDDAPEGMLF